MTVATTRFARPGSARLALVGLCTAAVLLGAGCTRRIPDDDGLPGQSRPLALGDWQRDELACGKKSGFFRRELREDCADWYSVAIRGKGTLIVDLVAVESAEGRDGAAIPSFELQVANAAGKVRETRTSDGQSRLRVSVGVSAGEALLKVGTAAPKTVFEYELRGRFEPAPVAKPRFETVESRVLEVERVDDGRSMVLIDRGAKHGLRRGLRGRLVEGGRTIAEIGITEVYPEGSRALLDGDPSEPITASTIAEIDRPL